MDRNKQALAALEGNIRKALAEDHDLPSALYVLLKEYAAQGVTRVEADALLTRLEAEFEANDALLDGLYDAHDQVVGNCPPAYYIYRTQPDTA